ncbi:uncharacterized protein M8220_014812 [Acridotheres tristis]
MGPGPPKTAPGPPKMGPGPPETAPGPPENGTGTPGHCPSTPENGTRTPIYCEDVDECAERGEGPCERGLICLNTPGSFECHCPPPRAGTPGQGGVSSGAGAPRNLRRGGGL